MNELCFARFLLPWKKAIGATELNQQFSNRHFALILNQGR
jgi:hypothetical protein